MGNLMSRKSKSSKIPFHTDLEATHYYTKLSSDSIPRDGLKNFTFSELKAATRNFHHSLEEGLVYKGWVDENSLAPSKHGKGMVVAVKWLMEDGYGQQDHKEWLAEIKCFAQLRHPNLVKVLGYCLENEKRFLVYEFMHHGNLKNHLFKRNSYSETLSWSLRMRVALDVAKGLAFLHSCERKCLSGGFKASKILLDSYNNAKIYDIVLVRDEETLGNAKRFPILAAPEFYLTGVLSSRSDVYIFGVLLLECLTGKKAFDKDRPIEERVLADWAEPYLTNKLRILDILDPHLEGQCSINRVLKAASLTLQCLNMTSELRPTMDKVVTYLQQLQD